MYLVLKYRPYRLYATLLVGIFTGPKLHCLTWNVKTARVLDFAFVFGIPASLVKVTGNTERLDARGSPNRDTLDKVLRWKP